MAEMVEVAPAPWLASVVSGYSRHRFRGFSPGMHLGLPSPWLTVVVSLDGPLQVAVPGGHGLTSFTALVAGVQTGPVGLIHEGSQHVVSFEVAPTGARSVFGVPARMLAGDVVALDEVIAPQVSEVAERLAASDDPAQWGEVLDRVFSLRDTRDPATQDVTRHAWRRIVDSGGRLRIGDLAEETGYSRRHLSARFVDEYGVTPKLAARIARFERSRDMLRAAERAHRITGGGRCPGLAENAVRSGYYDQAHLAREWNELAGCPPTTWLATEVLPFVQDTTRATTQR
jgi:AraC-like DNA-binding protein